MPDKIKDEPDLPQDARGKMPEPPLDLYNHLPFQIGMLTNLIRQVTSDFYVQKSGLSAREWRVLAMLGCQGPMIPAQIATATGMDRATITRAVSRLEALGYVFTGGDKADRRRKVLYLTEKAVEICDEIRPIMEVQGQELQNVLNKTELKYYYQIMDKLQVKAKQMLVEL
ncbi:MAG: winged helix-turn-helix transcriptional regulator [Emcibacter sp.]|nr:winged helix-turn-helix transcriptional regulator [Emcibacter sp.]